MTPNIRQRELLQALHTRGPASIEELARRLGVTVQTVRRDATQLSQAGLVSRFHGGLAAPDSTTQNIRYSQRASMNADAKQRIARAVAAHIPNGSSLCMNIGTTMEAIAQALLEHENLRVVTNNLN